MQKIVIHRAGGYDQLKLETHADLTPRSGEICVAVESIGVNYADCCVRWGVYGSAKEYVGWPITPGFEFAGRVTAKGEGASVRFSVGDRVFGLTRFDAYATQVCVPEHQLFLIPEKMSSLEAGGFWAVAITAYHALFQLVRIRPGGTVLVHSAAGGVGSYLVRLAKNAGYKVIGIVGASHKVSAVEKNGADWVIDKSLRADFWPEVARISPRGLDAIFDANGGESFKKSYRHLSQVGKLIVYGSHTLLPKEGGRLQYGKMVLGYLKMPRFNPFDLIQHNRTIAGFNLSYLFAEPELLAEAANALLEFYSAGILTGMPVQAFPLAEVGKAHALIESGQSIGKLVLTV